MTHSQVYLAEVREIVSLIDASAIEKIVEGLVSLRQREGKLFILGLGGSAANASHAVNDFRKLCGIEAYAPTDNVSELTARANDEGWNYLVDGSFWKQKDALLILSVGGGALNVSFPLCVAIDQAKEKGMQVLGIVGRDGGYTKNLGDCVFIVPTVQPTRITPHTEAFQSVILHCLVSHPDLQRKPTKW